MADTDSMRTTSVASREPPMTFAINHLEKPVVSGSGRRREAMSATLSGLGVDDDLNEHWHAAGANNDITAITVEASANCRCRKDRVGPSG